MWFQVSFQLVTHHRSIKRFKNLSHDFWHTLIFSYQMQHFCMTSAWNQGKLAGFISLLLLNTKSQSFKQSKIQEELFLTKREQELCTSICRKTAALHSTQKLDSLHSHCDCVRRALTLPFLELNETDYEATGQQYTASSEKRGREHKYWPACDKSLHRGGGMAQGLQWYNTPKSDRMRSQLHPVSA